jgi:hypothetical protein
MAKKFLTPVGLPSGTGNPGTGSEGELFYRSDLQAIFMFNGTEWLPQANADTVFNILADFGLIGGDSGSPQTSAFNSTISGGSPSDEVTTVTYDGGQPDSSF